MKLLWAFLPMVLLVSACADVTTGSTPLPTRTVSFASDVAPVLERSCATCHSAGYSSGGVTLCDTSGKADYADIKAKGSEIVSTIRSGSMPRGGGAVSSTDLSLIQAWVNQGSLNN